MTPLVVKKQNYENAKIITEQEYRTYRKKLAKDTLLKLKYPNGAP
jgi:PHD/YefM family antitoxin component YafN of YafNO toxin-antitoxin module